MFNAIRQAALDPTTQTEILRAFAFRPVPANDMGVAAQSSCGLQPITACVAQAANGSLRAVFSYNNPTPSPVTIPSGADNNVTGGSADFTLPEAFASGQHAAVFAVPMSSGATVTWTLNGQAATASTATVRCTAAVVSQIGVDQYSPFPAAATPSCRLATPAEARYPASKLPPAARANTCVSIAYNYLGTLGFKWRNVDSDADDTAGLAADAALALGDTAAAAATTTTTATSDAGNVQMVQQALFGKLFRRVIQAVGGVAHAVVDGARKGLRAVTGVFIGSTDIDVTIDPQYTDAAFTAGTMTQDWGANFGKPISLQGLELRANRSVFLSVANLDANNHARVKVLNHLSGARICFRMTSPAGFITSLFTPDEVCTGQTVTKANVNVTLPVAQEEVNVMAQMIDVRGYMSRVGQVDLAGAEVVTGRVADLIGRIQGVSDSTNKNRAFTPCLGFSWKNEVEIYLELISAAATSTTFDYVDKKVTAFAGQELRSVSHALQLVIDQQAALSTLVVQNADTALGTEIATAKAAVDDAVTKLSAAKNAATVLAQQADDFATAAGTAARYTTGNNPAVHTAEQAVTQTINNVNAQVALTTTLVQTATTATAAAAAATATLATQVAGTDVEAAIDVARDNLNAAVGEVTAVATVVIGKLAATVSSAVVGGLALIIGGVIAEAFEFSAGGDILLPGASGDHSNLTSRGVMTHEFGHFVLCNLLEQTSPATFGLAYDDAAVQGIVSGQSVSAIGATLNESFADLIASQVAGGTNYARPASSKFSGSLNVCYASDTNCVEANFTNNDVKGSFNSGVLRDVSLFTDAFDGVPLSPFVTDVPTNGNEWQAGLTLAPMPGQDGRDEVVNLSGPGYSRWIRHAMSGFSLIREDNFFRGLSDAMVDDGFNWCARCQVFRLHTLDMSNQPLCKDQWVGQRPTFNANGTTGSLTCVYEGCPAGTTPNATTQACDPPCPPGSFFDPFQLTCVSIIL